MNLISKLFCMLGSPSQKSKQKSKRKYSKNTQSTKGSGRTFTHVTTEERLRIIELRGQGFTTRPIAEELGRSTRTINIVLKEQGLNGRIAKKGVALSAVSSPDFKAAFDMALDEKLGPILVESIGPLLDKDPKLVKKIIFKHLDIEQTLDEAIEEELKTSPECLRRLVEHRLAQIEHNGRTEMDILREGLALVATISDIIHKGDWPAAVRDIGTSGALEKIVESFVSLKRGKADPAYQQFQSPSHSKTEETTVGAAHSDVSSCLNDRSTVKEKILASQTPPDNQVSERELQQRKARIVAAIRKPIPDLSAKLAELMNPEMLPLSSSEPTTGTVKGEILASQTPSDNQVSERELQQRKARIVAAIRKPLFGTPPLEPAD